MTRPSLDISWISLFRIVSVILGLYLVWRLSTVLLLLMGVFIFVAAANPIITSWQTRMKRQYATTLFLFLVLLVLGLIIGLVVPALASQLAALASDVPLLAERVSGVTGRLEEANRNADLARQAVELFRSGVDQIPAQVVSSVRAIFGVLAGILTVVFLSYYLLLEEKNARDFFHQILPTDRYLAVYETVRKISDRLGAWVRAQAILMIFVGVLNLGIYLVLGVPSPLPLALWAGLAEIIPFIGPLIGAVPAVLIAVATGKFLQALLILIFALAVVQQIENYFIVPKLMGRSVGLSPVLVIFAVLVGGTLFGIVGALVAVPAAATIAVVVSEWASLRQLWEPSE